MKQQIILKQPAIIEHKLKEAGAKVTKRLNDMNIEGQVVTTDTIKSVKELRAELRKEHSAFESDRKVVKGEITKPYDEFNELYKSEISDKYIDADNVLKTKILDYENTIKDALSDTLKIYFDELVSTEEIDFLKFDQLGIKINLSTTESAYKKMVNEFVDKVKSDLVLINSQEFKDEILVKYKSTLDVSNSITSVSERKAKEKAERDARLKKELLRRKSVLEGLGYMHDEGTNCFVFDDSTFIPVQEIKEMNDSEFDVRMSEIKELQAKPESFAAPVPEQKTGGPISAQKKPSSFKKPQEQAPAKDVTACFEATAPFEKLKALGEYMKQNGINYKNVTDYVKPE